MQMIQPIGTDVLIRRRAREEVSPGGIIIPEGARDQVNAGRVIAKGQKVRELALGDEVIFTRYDGTDLTDFLGELGEFVLVKEEDILAKEVPHEGD